MNPWRRFKSTIQRQRADRIPVAMLGTTRFHASLWGHTIFALLHQPSLLLECQARTFRRFPEILFIPGVWPDYGTASMLSAMGCPVTWPTNAMPYVGAVIKNPADIGALTVPNPQQDGMMPWFLQTLLLARQQPAVFGDNLHFLWSLGPGELASYLWGVTDLLLNLYLEPQAAHRLLNIAADTIIAWLKAQQRVLPDAEGILLTDDLVGLMSPPFFVEFLAPYHRRIREEFAGHTIVFHCDTDVDKALEPVRLLGYEAFHLGKTMDLAATKAAMAGGTCLMGNVDPLDLMQRGTPADVREAGLACLRAAADDGFFILAPGGGNNENTPAANVDALVDATISYAP